MTEPHPISLMVPIGWYAFIPLRNSVEGPPILEGMDTPGTVASVNVGGVRTVEWRGRTFTTAIVKSPVDGAVPIRGVNLDGDDQADRQVHGGDVRAVYAYATEDYAYWEEGGKRSIPPGTFGENVTTAGVDVGGALIGERWQVGTAVLQVTSPRVPCYKLGFRMDDPAFPKRFADALRPGAYMSIVTPGEVRRGDAVRIVSRPSHDLTIKEMTRIYLFDRSRLHAFLEIADMPAHWRDWAAEAAGKGRAPA